MVVAIQARWIGAERRGKYVNCSFLSGGRSERAYIDVERDEGANLPVGEKALTLKELDHVTIVADVRAASRRAGGAELGIRIMELEVGKQSKQT